MIITDRYNDNFTLLFKALSNRKRLMIALHLAEQEKPLSVQAISSCLSINRHETSQLCSVLKKAGIILSQREGKSILYRFNGAFPLALFRRELSNTVEGQ